MSYPLQRVVAALVLIACAHFEVANAQEAPAGIPVARVVLRPAESVPELVCPKRPRRPAPPALDPDPPEMPSEQDIETLPQASIPEARMTLPPAPALPHPVGRMRVAVWGDSHMAAGFFTDELVRIAGLDADQARPALLPASFGRAGVRLAVRKVCIDGAWRHESAHYGASAVARSAPGLVSMVSSSPGAEVAVDLRAARGSVLPSSVRVLYEGQGAPLRLALAVDGGTEEQVTLPPHSGPGALELVSSAPVSLLRLQLLEGTLQLQGVALGLPESARLQLDVFGFPGATVEGWARASRDGVRAWFAPDAYDLVVLGYGTNEGNQHPFDALAYRRSLNVAVAKLRGTFPQAQCVLIGPGDRGVLVRRSQKGHKAQKGQKKPKSQKTASALTVNPALLRFTRIHAEIAAIQAEVAQEAGCGFWGPWHTMGGAGGAYRWARMGLMAPDLIHFTVKGYQKLADSFATASGWSPTSVVHER